MKTYEYRVDNIPLLHPDKTGNEYNFIAPSKLDSQINKLEDGIADHVYVTSNKQRLIGSVFILVSIIGFICMGVMAEEQGVCPRSFSLVLCFGIYIVLGILFLTGIFFACGLIGFLGSLYCCELCAQCGQLFVCCMWVSDDS